jgi:NADPH2:quinone reductase
VFLFCVGGGSSNQLIDHGLEWIRDRGKIIIVGDLKMDFSRKLMFRKEAQVLISRAGGAGRYDAAYEKEGVDYPIGYVRWTEGRNMSEYIRLLSEGRIMISPLISKTFSIDQAAEAYKLYADAPNDILGALLEYDVNL